ncbi:helix-turn-helix domain-containing protein [Couchioplanes caeruleus]|uniref:Helix-turn-helix protein n=1 Tax=Couchioplanes caeruleus TaxID=56438 RepID=A0A3N1GVC4_9ACTN|nr:helix-turn-helix domain-containing protein [Couchioplanes caeruleus]ROP34195.1 helix-turn-helix protein [Couchioplanes caeruleus]
MPEPGPNPPSPDATTTPAEYVAALRALREWSGLTYRQLAAKADACGDVLPSSTIASALGRSSLPRRQVVTAFVRACGLGDDEAVHWAEARDAIAAGRVASPSDAASEMAEGAAPMPEVRPVNPRAGTAARRRFPAGIAAAVLLLVTGGAAVLVRDGVRDQDGEGAVQRATDGPRRGDAGGAPIADGWYLLRPAHVDGHGLCLGEGRERNGRTDRPLVVQRPCDQVSPDTYVQSAGAGVVEIRWRHPKHGVGCLTVDEAYPGDGALLAPADCTGAAHQRYLLEAVDVPVPGGYRLRPVHSGLCVGILGGPAEDSAGAEAVQTPCTGAPDQELVFTATRQASRPS